MIAATFATSSFSQIQNRPDFFAEALKLQQGRTTTLISLKDSSYHYSAWSKATVTWDFIRRNVYRYNSFYKENGNLSSSNSSGSGWIYEDNAKNYVYDVNQRLLEVTLEGWSGSWSDYYKTLYTYDVAGNVLSKTDQVWLSGAWQNREYSSYTYSGNLRTSALLQYWDATTNSWVNNTRSTFAYTGGQLTSSTDEDWNATSWTNAMRRTNFVYAGTDLLSYEFEMWDASMGAYVLATKTSFGYDTNHHMLTSFIELWNTSTTSWEKFMQTNYSYDSLWNQTEIMEEIWDAGTGSWTNSSYIIHYYTTGTVGLNEKQIENALSIYPNPSADQVTVSCPENKGPFTLMVSDLSGKTVLRYEINQAGPFTIDIRILEAGMYFMELKYQQTSIKGKFIKN
jgi:hypothetical protein